jgi:hypothetical protein
MGHPSYMWNWIRIIQNVYTYWQIRRKIGSKISFPVDVSLCVATYGNVTLKTVAKTKTWRKNPPKQCLS